MRLPKFTAIFFLLYTVLFSHSAYASPKLNGRISAPFSAYINDTITISGSFSKKLKRPVELQQKKQSVWVKVAKVRSKKNGKYIFNVTLEGPQTYRVYAAQLRTKLRVYRALVSPTKIVRDLVRPWPTVPAINTPSATAIPCSNEPCAPLSLARGNVVSYDDPTGRYWVYIPGADQGNTSDEPLALLIWLHGCGGSFGDLYGAADYYGYRYIAIAPDGAENSCWDMDSGTDRVSATRQSAISHFNINQQRVILGGYSSGGDLAYRAAFLNADKFAGVLAINTSPFRDNGTSLATAQAAAWKFHVFHLLSQNDSTYPSAGVNNELDSLLSLGFDVQREMLAGATHYDHPSDSNHPTDGTFYNFQHLLIEAHMNNNWVSPKN